MILGVLAITGPDSGVVGGPVYVRYHLGQSLGAVLEGEKLIVKSPSHILHKKGKGFDLVRWVPLDDLGSACLHWSGLWRGRRTRTCQVSPWPVIGSSPGGGKS